MTLDAFLQKWIGTLDAHAKPKTVATYRYSLDLYVPAELASRDLAGITLADLATHFAALKRAGVSPQARRLYRTVLSSAMTTAVAWRLLTSSPVQGVKVERAPKPEHKTWSAAERQQFLARVGDNDPLAALYAFMCVMGLRSGEARGLRWKDICWFSSKVSIRRTIVDIDGGVQVGEPKSQESRRTLKIPAILLDMLAQLKKQQGELVKEEAYLFPRSYDGAAGDYPMSKAQLHRSFKAAWWLAQVPKIKVHECRHTAATLMLADGVDPLTVSRILGHASVATTLDIYAGVIAAHAAKADAVMDKAWGP